jgi:hypothetical protein
LADFSNSVTRYFRNNYADGPRQDAYDLFLGNYLPPTTGLLFVDRRPILIQSIPYIFFASVFLELAVFILPRQQSDGGMISLRIFALFWLAIGVWAASFVKEHGMLYVNWPKLNAPTFAVEGYNEALNKAKKDKIIGRWLTSGGSNSSSHERSSSSNIRLVHLEEGKKRIE